MSLQPVTKSVQGMVIVLDLIGVIVKMNIMAFNVRIGAVLACQRVLWMYVVGMVFAVGQMFVLAKIHTKARYAMTTIALE
jgi:hypothetical protein